jgi:diketogulonate reductase-like aldo/keto reductase
LAQTLAQPCAIGLFRKASNQVQFSPFEFRRALLETCDRRGVALEAYSPLGTGRHLGDRRVAAMAERLGRTPAQVLIRWPLQRDLVVLPKSTHRERIERNAQVFDFQLSDEDMGRWTGWTAPAAPTAASSGPGGELSGAGPRPWLLSPKAPAPCGITRSRKAPPAWRLR